MLNSMENHLCSSAFEERTGFKYLIGFLTVQAYSVLHKWADRFLQAFDKLCYNESDRDRGSSNRKQKKVTKHIWEVQQNPFVMCFL